MRGEIGNEMGGEMGDAGDAACVALEWPNRKLTLGKEDYSFALPYPGGSTESRACAPGT
jgi:hypothetical protein